MFLSEWRESPSAPCFAGKKNLGLQLASRCCWSRARSWHASELVSVLIGPRTYHLDSWLTYYFYKVVFLKVVTLLLWRSCVHIPRRPDILSAAIVVSPHLLQAYSRMHQIRPWPLPQPNSLVILTFDITPTKSVILSVSLNKPFVNKCLIRFRSFFLANTTGVLISP